jgi:hypothetical protein
MFQSQFHVVTGVDAACCGIEASHKGSCSLVYHFLLHSLESLKYWPDTGAVKSLHSIGITFQRVLYIAAHVRVCMCVYIHMYVSIYMCVCACVRVCARARVCVRMYVCMHACMLVYVYVCY